MNSVCEEVVREIIEDAADEFEVSVYSITRKVPETGKKYRAARFAKGMVAHTMQREGMTYDDAATVLCCSESQARRWSRKYAKENA